MTPEKKDEALRLIRIHWNTAPKQICFRLGISSDTLYRLIRDYRKKYQQTDTQKSESVA